MTNFEMTIAQHMQALEIDDTNCVFCGVEKYQDRCDCEDEPVAVVRDRYIKLRKMYLDAVEKLHDVREDAVCFNAHLRDIAHHTSELVNSHKCAPWGAHWGVVDIINDSLKDCELGFLIENDRHDADRYDGDEDE